MTNQKVSNFHQSGALVAENGRFVILVLWLCSEHNGHSEAENICPVLFVDLPGDDGSDGGIEVADGEPHLVKPHVANFLADGESVGRRHSPWERDTANGAKYMWCPVARAPLAIVHLDFKGNFGIFALIQIAREFCAGFVVAADCQVRNGCQSSRTWTWAQSCLGSAKSSC